MITRKEKKKMNKVIFIPIFFLFIFFFISIMDCTLASSSSSDVHHNQQYFEVVPRPIEVVEGTKEVELECQVGHLSGQVQWSKDGFLLGYEAEIVGYPRYRMEIDSKNGIYNLIIKNVQIDDEGDYQCQVGPGPNKNKPIRAGAKLTVIIPPTGIVIRPFYSMSNLPIAVKYQSIHESINTSSTHHKRSNHHKSSSQSNHHHSSSSQLSHHHKNQLKVIEINEGEKIILICGTVTGTKPATRLIWFKNDQELIPSVNNSSVTTPPAGGNGVTNTLALSVITFKNTDSDDQLFKSETTLTQFVTLSDQGSVFRCEGIHPGLTSGHLNRNLIGHSHHKGVSDSIKISILYPAGSPIIEGYREKDGQLKAGDQITLACLSRGGNPLPRLSWIKNDVIVDETYSVTDDLADGSVSYYEGNNQEGSINGEKPTNNGGLINSGLINSNALINGGKSKLTTNTYSFTVEPRDNGATFKCTSSNPISVSSNEVKLSVIFPPVSIRIIGPSIGRVNDLLSYECLIGPSNPIPDSVSWFINDLIIGTWYKGNTSNHSQGVSSSSQGAKSSYSLGASGSDGNLMKELGMKSNGEIIVEHSNHDHGFMSRSNLSLILNESIKSVSCVAVSSVTISSLAVEKFNSRGTSGLGHSSNDGLSSASNTGSSSNAGSSSNFGSNEMSTGPSDHLTRSNPSSSSSSFGTSSSSSSSSFSSSSDSTTIRTSINVRVLYPPGDPSITGYNGKRRLLEGDLLTLKCSSLGGFPLPNIKWTKSVLKHRSDHQRLSGHHRTTDTSGHRHKSVDYQKVTDHDKVSRSQGHGHEMVNYDEKEISGLDTRSGHSGISSEVVIRITPSDNQAIYKCLVFNEAINEPKVSSVPIDEVTFMSDKLTASSDTVNVWSDSIKAPTDYTEVTCSSGECNPRCNISWYLNGQLISGQSISNDNKQLIGSNSANFLFKINTSYTEGLYGSSLTFSKLIISNRRKSWSSNDDGSKITCVTSNVIGKEVKKNITINVLYKPEFLVNISKRYKVKEGRNEEFSISLPSKGNPSLMDHEWFKDSLPLTSSIISSSPALSSSSFSSSSLSLSSLAREREARRMRGRRIEGKDLKRSEKEKLIDEGREVETDDDEEEEDSSFDDAPQSNGGQKKQPFKFFQPRITINGPLLTIRSISRSDRGLYMLRSTNLIGSSNISFSLNVLYPPDEPTITGYESGKALNVGDLVTLKCESKDGLPPPSMKWSRSILNPSQWSEDGNEHDNEGNDSESRKGRYHEEEIPGIEMKISNESRITSELVVKIVPNDNKALYKCLVSNEALVTPRIASVMIDPVHFMSEKLSTSSDTVNLWNDSVKAPTDYTEVTCSSGECNPGCNVSWSYNGQIITNNPSSYASPNDSLDRDRTRDSLDRDRMHALFGAIFKVDTSTSTGPLGGKITHSKLLVSNRRKQWTSADESSNFTCVSSYGNQEVVKVLTITVSSVEFVNDISLINSNFYKSINDLDLVELVKGSPVLVIFLGLIIITLIVFSLIMLIKNKIISGKSNIPSNSTTTTGSSGGSSASSSSNSPSSSSDQSVRRGTNGSDLGTGGSTVGKDGKAGALNGKIVGVNGSANGVIVGLNGGIKSTDGNILGGSGSMQGVSGNGMGVSGSIESPVPSLPVSSSLLSGSIQVTNQSIHSSPASSSIASQGGTTSTNHHQSNYTIHAIPTTNYIGQQSFNYNESNSSCSQGEKLMTLPINANRTSHCSLIGSSSNVSNSIGSNVSSSMVSNVSNLNPYLTLPSSYHHGYHPSEDLNHHHHHHHHYQSGSSLRIGGERGGGGGLDGKEKMKKRVKLMIDGHLIPDDHSTDHPLTSGGHCSILPPMIDTSGLHSHLDQMNGYENDGLFDDQSYLSTYQNTDPALDYVHCDSPQITSDHIHGHLHVSIRPDIVNNGHYDRTSFKYKVTKNGLYHDEHL